jgi:hypothetical protein
MIESFPRHAQPAFSNSCLPTCVLSVLEQLGMHATTQSVSAWCRETADGCDWYEAQEGLAEEFAVEDLQGEWDRIRQFVERDGHPVIVTIGNPWSLLTEQILPDHAIVVVGFEFVPGTEEVVYMDPATGTLERMPLDRFLFGWSIPGEKAFTIR